MKFGNRVKALLNWHGVAAVDSSTKQFLRRIIVRLLSPPDIYSRYQVLLKLLRKYGYRSERILEVGSGATGLTRYSKRRIYGADISFTGPSLGLMFRVLASGTALPFRDRSFDWVVSADVLEHLPGDFRRQTISEMVRVARRGVLAVAPSGEESRDAERRLWTWLREKHLSMPQWMSEHRACGLPEKSEIKDALDAAVAQGGRTASIISRKTSNIHLWSLNCRVFTAAETLPSYRALALLLLPLAFLPFGVLWNYGRGYRCCWQLLFKADSQVRE